MQKIIPSKQTKGLNPIILRNNRDNWYSPYFHYANLEALTSCPKVTPTEQVRYMRATLCENAGIVNNPKFKL